MVSLAVPEEEAGDGKEDGECRSDDRVDLLAGVEATLRCSASAKPGEVVIVEVVDLTRCGEQAATVTGKQDERERSQPDERRVDVDVLQQRSPADQLGQARQVQAQAGHEENEEGARMDPVKRAFGA